jgi:shikimate dehydrogenase
MHRAAFSELSLDGWSYQLLPVPPGLFAETVAALPAAGFVGANVTLPHKQAALALADSATSAAREIGAANMLSFAADGRVHAGNTDAPALIAALPLDPSGARAVVLGAGGTARAAAWALRAAGASVAIWNRTPERAHEVAEMLGVRAIASVEPADLLVNCTTVGLEARAGESEETLQFWGIDTDLLSTYACVVDYVYGSEETHLLKSARRLAVRTLDGYTLLCEQGAISFELWTGQPAPRAVMARAVEEA